MQGLPNEKTCWTFNSHTVGVAATVEIYTDTLVECQYFYKLFIYFVVILGANINLTREKLC